MKDSHPQREYGAAVEAHYGLKNVAKVSMPTNEHDDPLVMHISMLVSKEDIKGIAARFAGEVPAKTSIGELTVKLDTSLVQGAIREMLEPGAMYLPPALANSMKAHEGARYAALIDAGAIVCK